MTLEDSEFASLHRVGVKHCLLKLLECVNYLEEVLLFKEELVILRF